MQQRRFPADPHLPMARRSAMSFLPCKRSSLESVAAGEGIPEKLFVAEVELDGAGGVGSFRGGSLYGYLQTGFLHVPDDTLAEGDELDIPLLEVGEVLVEALDVGLVVEDDDVERAEVEVVQILGDAFDKHADGVVQAGFVEKCGDGGGAGSFALGDEELLSLVLGADEAHHRLRGAVAEEYLAFAVDYVLLQVIGHQFGGAEVLHGLGNLETELFRQGEVGVYGMSGREHYCGVVGEIYALVAEFTRGEGLYPEKGTEDQFCAEFCLQGLVGVHLRGCVL